MSKVIVLRQSDNVLLAPGDDKAKIVGAVTDRSLVELQIGRGRESAWVLDVYGSGRDGWQAEIIDVSTTSSRT